jgi:predicted acylesterase/phospholipase RssA
MYKTLVLAPSAQYGLLHIGALQYLLDSKLLNVQNIVGSSSGSIIAYLFCIGIYPHAMFKIYVDKISSIFIQSTKINIQNIINDSGLYTNSHIRDILVKITLSKCKDIFTFKKLYEYSKINLVINAYNCTTNQNEYFSHTHSPDMDVIHAVCMSACIPILFKPCIYQGAKYVDGMMGSVFAIDYVVDDMGITDKSVIGIRTKDELLPSTTFVEMVALFLRSRSVVEFRLVHKAYKQYYTLLNIDTPPSDNFGNMFALDKMNYKELYTLFEHGYEFAKNATNTKVLLPT